MSASMFAALEAVIGVFMKPTINIRQQIMAVMGDLSDLGLHNLAVDLDFLSPQLL